MVEMTTEEHVAGCKCDYCLGKRIRVPWADDADIVMKEGREYRIVAVSKAREPPRAYLEVWENGRWVRQVKEPKE